LEDRISYNEVGDENAMVLAGMGEYCEVSEYENRGFGHSSYLVSISKVSCSKNETLVATGMGVIERAVILLRLESNKEEISSH